MTSAQDHKRAKDGDQGLNTGGMGTFSPSPFYTPEIQKFCEEQIYQPTMDAMKAEGRDFVGILFVGLMMTQDGPKVLNTSKIWRSGGTGCSASHEKRYYRCYRGLY